MEALAHAARVPLDPLLLPALQPDEFEQLFDPSALPPGLDPVQLREVAQVVERREPLVEAAVAAEDVADPLRTQRASSTTSRPRTRACPDVGISSVISILIVVVLPAPFGPSRPNSSPSSISKLTPRTASTSRERRRNVPVVVL